MVRFAHWFGARRRRWIDGQIRVQIEMGALASERLKRSRAVSEAVEWVVVALVSFIAGILALDRLGIPLTTLVAPATVIGIGLGFGAQQMVADLLAGFFLLAEHQFAFGDLIRLSVPGQATGVTGTVEELTLRVTKLRTAQGELVVVPNSAMRQVTNLSKDWSQSGDRHPGGGHRGPREGDVDPEGRGHPDGLRPPGSKGLSARSLRWWPGWRPSMWVTCRLRSDRQNPPGTPVRSGA